MAMEQISNFFLGGSLLFLGFLGVETDKDGILDNRIRKFILFRVILHRERVHVF